MRRHWGSIKSSIREFGLYLTTARTDHHLANVQLQADDALRVNYDTPLLHGNHCGVGTAMTALMRMIKISMTIMVIT